jgi:hypothetical protein
MKKFFLSLRDLLVSIPDANDSALPMIKAIRKWNNQVEWLMDEKGARLNLFEMPAVFIAFKFGKITQLGNGVQLYENFTFELHILKWSLDTGKGTFEDDLDIFDLKELIYLKVNKFQPGLQLAENDPNYSETSACIRIAEQEDNRHYGVYHFIQTYQTTFTDLQRAEPYLGVDGPVPPLPLEIDAVLKSMIDSATNYSETAQYLVINSPIVIYQDNYFKLLSDTPNPAGPFDSAKWEAPNPYPYIPS